MPDIPMCKSWSVSQPGVKLLAFLKLQMPEVGTRQLKKALEDNRCQVNQRTERFGSMLLGVGDVVTFQDTVGTTESFAFTPSRLLYEDQDLFIYNKPPGIGSEDLLQFLFPSLILVHRLDRDTTGALIFSKSEVSFRQMVDLFKKHLVTKTYFALVDGKPHKKNGMIDNYLGELHRYQGQTLIGQVDKANGLRAITAWECVKKGQEASLIKCFPKTGRTHQIRVHLSGIEHPILGDHQYGKHFRCSYHPPRIMLHAFGLSFPHPSTGQATDVKAPLPDDFTQALAYLKMSVP